MELVGWTVLSGKDTNFQLGIVTTTVGPGPGGPGGAIGSVGAVGTFDNAAHGQTIVNAKAGVRADFGPKFSIYAGYGTRLTGDFWYKDIFRFEVRRTF